MSEFDDLHCPFRTEIVAAVPLQMALLLHAAGGLALMLILR
jgi:hypothetical protein